MHFADIGQFFSQQFNQRVNPWFKLYRPTNLGILFRPRPKPTVPTTDDAADKLKTVMNLIAFEQDLIQDFFECTTLSLKQSIKSLAQPLKTATSTQHSIEHIFCIMHQIKGDAAMLNMDAVSRQAHDMESLLARLNTSGLKATDLRELIPPLKAMIQTLREIKSLFHQLTDGGWHQSHTQQTQTLALKLEYLIKKLALDCDKRVMIINDGYTDAAIPPQLRRIVAQAITQLARNAVIHGFEPESERVRNHKTPYGCFHIRVVRQGQYITLITRDDGRGIDTEKVRKAALKSGQFDTQKVALWREEDVLQAIFVPGLSTHKTITQHAGRGVGMDVIKQAVEQHHGDIKVESRAGYFTEFSMRFPVQALSEKEGH